MINTERLNLMIRISSHLIELYNICSHPQANIYTPKGLHNSKLDTQQSSKNGKTIGNNINLVTLYW